MDLYTAIFLCHQPGFVCAEDLDEAVLDRVDEQLEVGLPDRALAVSVYNAIV